NISLLAHSGAGVGIATPEVALVSRLHHRANGKMRLGVEIKIDDSGMRTKPLRQHSSTLREMCSPPFLLPVSLPHVVRIGSPTARPALYPQRRRGHTGNNYTSDKVSLKHVGPRARAGRSSVHCRMLASGGLPQRGGAYSPTSISIRRLETKRGTVGAVV